MSSFQSQLHCTVTANINTYRSQTQLPWILSTLSESVIRRAHLSESDSQIRWNETWSRATGRIFIVTFTLLIPSFLGSIIDSVIDFRVHRVCHLRIKDWKNRVPSTEVRNWLIPRVAVSSLDGMWTCDSRCVRGKAQDLRFDIRFSLRLFFKDSKCSLVYGSTTNR